MQKSNSINITGQTTSSIYQWTFNLAETIGVQDKTAHILSATFLIIVSFIFLLFLDYFLRFFFNSIVTKFIKKSKTNWDDKLFQNKVQIHLSRFILIAIAQQFLPNIFIGFPSFIDVLTKLLGILMIFAIYGVANALLKTARDILRSSKGFVDKPVDSYIQVLQIFLIFVVGTLIVSVLTGNSPWSFLVSLGAASAILMLVFKDTILGFVASIQVSANDSVRVGDWIEMPKYGVDGDILQINLNNVRVQNWDKTIVTIPTYTLLSDSFKTIEVCRKAEEEELKDPFISKYPPLGISAMKKFRNLKRLYF
ncbi:mechanosensitive ion channel family protein [Sphingobacterium sp. IITKGP-BTPF85]|uniref:mechanosensitive ion channel family protein n=1 Tax=Sphingobacterium sp. IITKGP-BTPF85 TaxID=1338009 RepID=UPI000389E40D|nr:mechanosensitive ion channel domain-containing protein [Sphingobacterium sp. IITKGP-BTPF85]KKX46528.1 hypothetical protein L950_0231435 [Sphingobacterium sp. IITKGP-BTPF85]